MSALPGYDCPSLTTPVFSGYSSGEAGGSVADLTFGSAA